MRCSCGSISEGVVDVAVRFPKHNALPTTHPITDLLDLLGRRWALRVLWELRDEPLPFRRLREALRRGLDQRARASGCASCATRGLVESATSGAYALTADGRELVDQLRTAQRLGHAALRTVAARPPPPTAHGT